MKQIKYLFLAVLALSLNGCFYTISTVETTRPVPNPVVTSPVPSYSTTVVRPSASTHPTTTVVVQTNTPVYHDPCLYLDLHAVAAAFAESRSVREFELMLNSSRYMISNLDLNRDGYVDYLRVMEVVSGWNHVLTIQAVLGYNIFQNVATIVVERTASSIGYVQVIGEPYLYGPKYIIEPVFRRAPVIYTSVRYGAYTAWSSPYYWGSYPSCYSHPAPQQLSHYQAYVTTYCHNHDYCRETRYTETTHYTHYESVRTPVSRNDYARENPSQAFAVRNANTSSVNARDVRTATTTTTTTPSRTQAATTSRTPSTSTTTTTTTTTPSRQPSASTSTTSRQPSTSASTSRTQSSTAAPTTTTTTRVKESGAVTRTTTTTPARTVTTTPARTATTTERSQSSSTSRSSSTSSSSTSRTSSSDTPRR